MKYFALLTLVSLCHGVEFKICSLREVNSKTDKVIWQFINSYYEIEEDSQITASDIESVSKTNMANEPAILIKFTESGALKNHAFTTKFKRKHIAFIIDNKVLSAPMVIEPSKEASVISCSLPNDELTQLINNLQNAIKKIKN